MRKTTKFAYIILNQWVVAGRYYLGKLKIHLAHIKQMKIE